MLKASRPNQERWSTEIIVLHWLTAVCVIVLVVVGWELGAHAAHIGQRTMLLQWHASLGVALLAVLLVRILVRLVSKRPLSFGESQLRHRSALAVQVALYLAMIALVFTGVVAAAPRPFGPAVHLFGIWPLPRISGLPLIVMQNIRSIHAALVWFMIGLVGMHVMAAVYGTFVRGDWTLLRMVPWGRRPRKKSLEIEGDG
ncbi:cytochrome b [Pseudorhodoplanes sinuspersici]|uniref:Uncharacterized protein n=1 Tax=Pseudorhodoplanes sinuspersici TaxID=1235591 RepID=A0A1W6ZL21_9HYPH|nr:hypothetical protein CAK95_02365 [Pseudorhodoplanes sinuspersici]RKE68195.1 cytochrome b561 [Pseudorhodoplanes sinuspersici]